MPKPAVHTLTWSEESKTYVLLSPEHPPQAFDPGNEEPWFAWLITHSSFSFQGQCGHLNVLKEARTRGTGYWYAYHTVDHRARKRYLGHITHLTFAHLEQVAQDLGCRPASRPETTAGYLYQILIDVTSTWNQLEEASDWLQRLQKLAQNWPHTELLITAEGSRAMLALARGDFASAHEALQRLDALIEQEALAAHADLALATRLAVWLAGGDLTHAAEWAAQTTFSPEAWKPWQSEKVLMLVRITLAQQRYAQAVETLERFRVHLDQPGNVQVTISFLTLLVVALYHAGKREQAQETAVRLFALTEPEGSLRVYLDLGQSMREVLAGLLAESAPGPLALCHLYISRLLAAFEQEDKQLALLASAHHHQSIEPESPHVSSPLLRRSEEVPASPLTRAEQQVLRLLVAGQTYAEMAQALVVSPNTVKTQVSSIYRKLGVNRRAEAITLSQRLHLH